jgi:hypothetical protein
MLARAEILKFADMSDSYFTNLIQRGLADMMLIGVDLEYGEQRDGVRVASARVKRDYRVDDAVKLVLYQSLIADDLPTKKAALLVRKGKEFYENAIRFTLKTPKSQPIWMFWVTLGVGGPIASTQTWPMFYENWLKGEDELDGGVQSVLAKPIGAMICQVADRAARAGIEPDWRLQ